MVRTNPASHEQLRHGRCAGVAGQRWALATPAREPHAREGFLSVLWTAPERHVPAAAGFGAETLRCADGSTRRDAQFRVFLMGAHWRDPASAAHNQQHMEEPMQGTKKQRWKLVWKMSVGQGRDEHGKRRRNGRTVYGAKTRAELELRKMAKEVE